MSWDDDDKPIVVDRWTSEVKYRQDTGIAYIILIGIFIALFATQCPSQWEFVKSCAGDTETGVPYAN